MDISTSICTASAIGLLTREGLEVTLQTYPELLPHRPLLEEILLVSDAAQMHERLARDCERRMDELGGELASIVEANEYN